MNSLRSPAPNAGLFSMGAAMNKRNNVANSFTTNLKNAVNGAVPKGGPSPVVIVLIVALVALILGFAVFWRQIQDASIQFFQRLKVFLGVSSTPPPPDSDNEEKVLGQPEPPQDSQPDATSSMVEKVLPGMKQVFNISKNSYTYYDAEPLCKALGAELATYEQVKQAYAQGADWCNYGWVKGQMAVYPTQQATWEQIQNGPEDQRNVCGRPGVNGGYFDNPEMQFGVNCYGPKPDQKDHDATALASGQGAPLSVGGLDFEKKIAKYRGEANSIALLPWNRQAWSG
jgi:hypothetical protein